MDSFTEYVLVSLKQVLIALSFFAKGSYQVSIGWNFDQPVALSTVSCIINDVVKALNRPEVLSRLIQFPQTREEQISALRGLVFAMGSCWLMVFCHFHHTVLLLLLIETGEWEEFSQM